MKKILSVLMIGLCLCSWSAEEGEKTLMVPTTAVLAFEAREHNAKNDETGKSVADLLTEELGNADIETVERAELNKVLTELQLSSVGLVDADNQVKLGRLIGAKILVTGSIFKSGDKNYLSAKIIGTETSVVRAASVSATGSDFLELVPELAKKIVVILEKQSSKLLPKEKTTLSVADSLSKTLKGEKRKVYVKVTEDINVRVPDPAAETELKKLLLLLDFDVVESVKEAEFQIVGEAVASNSGSYHKFISATARLELSVYQVKNGQRKLLATGATKETIAGATYIIAAKDAIAQTALRMAAELFPIMK